MARPEGEQEQSLFRPLNWAKSAFSHRCCCFFAISKYMLNNSKDYFFYYNFYYSILSQEAS